MTGSERINAFAEADDTLDELSIAQDRPVDVFAAIADLGLTLTIARLDNLLGAVLPHGSGGVLLTSQRGARVQRYTAAHEVGHWILHRDEMVVDGEAEILHQARTERERQAQSFAAYFLMPPPLVEEVIARYGLRRKPVAPEQVYLASRDMRVSFEAAVRRLQNMRVIDRPEAAALLRTGRQTALRNAFGGRRPTDGNADLWRAEEAVQTLDGLRFDVDEHDEIVVTLPEARSSGWEWMDDRQYRERGGAGPRPRPLPPRREPPNRAGSAAEPQEPNHGSRPAGGDRRRPADVSAALSLLPAPTISSDAASGTVDPDDDPLAITSDEFEIGGVPAAARQRAAMRRSIAGAPDLNTLTESAPASTLVGGAGQRTLVVECREPGNWTFQLHYAHSFDPDTEQAAEYTLVVDIRQTPTNAFRAARMAEDLDRRIEGDPADDEIFEVTAR